jgi:hypothetical protein
MLNAQSPVHYKAFAFILSPHTFWVRQVLTLDIYVAQKEEVVAWRWREDVEF